jgi:transcriptional regulator with XRE-family HTH domain
MTDISQFPHRFVDACRARSLSPEQVAERAGLPAHAGRDLAETAIHLPLYRLCYVADALDVSLDWLLAREPAVQARARRAMAR